MTRGATTLRNDNPSRPGRQFNEPMKPSGHRTISPPTDLPEPLLRVDLSGYGFSSREIQEVLALEEPAVDAYAQIAHGRFAREKREAERVLEDFKARKERREGRGERGDGTHGIQSGGKRQQVYLDEQRKWVLFDPVRGWPPTMESNPPAIYERYSRYQMGNSKVVAYNTKSYAVALRRVPKTLEDVEVAYQKAGPRVVKTRSGSKGGLEE